MSEKAADPTVMSPLDHLAELRRRLIYVFLAVLVGFGISWFFVEDIFRVMMLPMIEVLGPEGKMIFTNPTEAFVTYIKVAVLAGLMMTTPVWLLQIWRFVGPGLYFNERRYVFLFVFFGTFFFLGGALFGYFKIIPLGLDFLINNF